MLDQVKRRTSLFSLFFVYFLDYFGFALVFGIFGPLILKPEYKMFSQSISSEGRHIALGILFAIFPLSQLFGAPIFGELSDRHGRKKSLYLSMLGSALGYFLSGLAILSHHFWLLLTSRAITGFFSGSRSICFAALADLSPEEKSRSNNYGMIGTLGGLSWIISMICGLFFADIEFSRSFNPALPFWITTALSLICCGVLLWFFSDTYIVKESVVVKPLKGLQNIFVNVSWKKLRLLYVYYLFLMMGWGINLVWLNPYTIDRFKVTHQQGIWLLLSTGTSWSLGSALINHFMLKKSSTEKVAKFGLIGLFLIFILCGVTGNYPLFSIFAIIASAFGSIAWTNALSLISLATSEDNQGRAMGLSQSIGSISFLLAPMIAGISAILKIEFVYPMAAILILFSLFAFYLHRIKVNSEKISKNEIKAKEKPFL